LRQRPADLGRTPAVDLAGLGSAEIMRAAVGVEAHRQRECPELCVRAGC
jgi:hypothetical protein